MLTKHDHSALEAFATGKGSPLPATSATPAGRPPQPQKAATERPGMPEPPPMPAQGRRPLQPLVSVDGGREYRWLFRCIFDFFERHFPPTLDDDYWGRAADDYLETGQSFHGDDFAISLLAACYCELDRQYVLLRDAAEAEAQAEWRANATAPDGSPSAHPQESQGASAPL